MDKSLLNSNLKRNGELFRLTSSGLLIMTSNSRKLNSVIWGFTCTRILMDVKAMLFSPCLKMCFICTLIFRGVKAKKSRRNGVNSFYMCSNLERCKRIRKNCFYYNRFYMCSNLERCKRWTARRTRMITSYMYSNLEGCKRLTG